MASKKCYSSNSFYINNSDIEEGEILPVKTTEDNHLDDMSTYLTINEQYIQYCFHILQNSKDAMIVITSSRYLFQITKQ